MTKTVNSIFLSVSAPAVTSDRSPDVSKWNVSKLLDLIIIILEDCIMTYFPKQRL